MMDLAAERGASSWLPCRPLSRCGFALSKGEFWVALSLRYNWRLPRMPATCGCGSPFSIAHALPCPTGGYPSIRHNEIRDVTAGLLKRVATNVAVEPHLQPLPGEQLRLRTAITDDNARLDVAANGVWGGRFERTFIDVRVFNPYAPSNQSSSLPATYIYRCQGLQPLCAFKPVLLPPGHLHLSMSGSSTLMRLQTSPPPSRPPTSVTRRLRSSPTNSDSVRWSTHRSCLQCFPPWVA